jgi:hypothetical protein
MNRSALLKNRIEENILKKKKERKGKGKEREFVF